MAWGGRRLGSGRKVKCLCGRSCKHKDSAYRRRLEEPSDEDLEKKLIEKFKTKGWD